MKKLGITQRDYIKANRKASREAEIENHTRPVNFCKVQKSIKVYDRKRSKAENKKALPYLFLYPSIDNTPLMSAFCRCASDFVRFHFPNTGTYYCTDYLVAPKKGASIMLLMI